MSVSLGVTANAIVEGSTQFNGSYGYGCHVLNNSYGSDSFNQTLQNAVRVAYRNKCVFVASRGNSGTPTLRYPACYTPDAAVINVGASGTNGQWLNSQSGNAYYGNNHWASSFGGGVDLVAPGAANHIGTTENPNFPYNFPFGHPEGYTAFDGTSAAAPHVAGVVALMLSEHNIANGAPNNLAPEDVERILERTAVDEGSAGYDPYHGHGRLQASAALNMVQRPQYTVVHSGAPNDVSYIEYPIQQISIMNNVGGLAQGNYLAQKVVVTHTYNHVFSSTSEIIDYWERPSSMTGFSQVVPVDGSTYAQYNFNISGNTATVYVWTTCWFVISSVGGANLYQWIPALPPFARTAYSLHVRDNGAVSVEEPLQGSPELRVWPSPARDQLNVLLAFESPREPVLHVVDMTGRVVLERNVARTGRLSIALPVEHLARGAYLLRVVANEKTYHARFIRE